MKSFQLVTGLLVAASALIAQQQYTISTYAGIPYDRGWFSDGGPATLAPLDFPLSVATDNQGNLYINDFQGWIIRQVNSAGVINTIAGDGTPGYAGDGAAATSAELLDVHSIAADTKGNVYLADTDTSRVRVVNLTSGNINTFAGNGTQGYSGDGGAATNAELYFPVGVAVDSAGNLYIADYGNYTVRKVTASGSSITTIAGTGVFAYGGSGDGGPGNKAPLAFPYAVAVDSAGNVFISDLGNQNIREVTTDGNIHTITTGVSAQSLAVDAADNLYYPNYLDSTVREIHPDGSQVILAGTGSAGYSGDGGPATFAQLSTPYGIALDGSGNIYVADTGNEIVRLLSPTSLALTGINNAASNASAAAAGAYISPGEIITIYGVGLGPPQLTPGHAVAGNYPFQVGGTSVIIGPPGFDYPAPILYSSASQVGAIVPYEVGIGNAVIATVTYNGQTTAPANLTVAYAAPGIFTVNGSGSGSAAAVNQNGSVNSLSSPAPLGSTISLYVTGEGRTYPNGVDGQINTAGNLPVPALPVSVSIGGQSSVVTYAGGQAGSVAGLMQVNVQIPTALAQSLNFSAGPVAVPVVLQVGNYFAQTGVTIAVSSN